MEALWLSPNKLQFTEAKTGWQSRPVIFPGIDSLEPNELDELVLWQRESAERDFKKAQPKKPPMTKSQQHDLGDVLNEIKDSKTRAMEVNHGKWW